MGDLTDLSDRTDRSDLHYENLKGELLCVLFRNWLC